MKKFKVMRVLFYQQIPPHDFGTKSWAKHHFPKNLGLQSPGLRELQQQHVMFLPNVELMDHLTTEGIIGQQ
jgi:hypothetical protein